MKKRANTISWPYIAPVVLDGDNTVLPLLILDHFPYAQLSVLTLTSRVDSSDDDHGDIYFSLNFPSVVKKAKGFGKASMGSNYARDQKKVVNEGRHFCRKFVKCIEYLQYIYFSLKQIFPHPLEWMRVYVQSGGLGQSFT
jgi:hypothetical protein